MPLSDTLIISVSVLAVGISIFTIYLVQKFIKEQKAEERTYDNEKAKELKKTIDFFNKKPKSEEKPKKTLREVELEV